MEVETNRLHECKGIPWFTLYNEPKALPQVGRGFANVQSVADVDEQIDGDACHTCKRRKTAPGPIAVDETDFAKRWHNGDKGLIVDLTMDGVSPLHNSRNVASSARQPRSSFKYEQIERRAQAAGRYGTCTLVGQQAEE